MSHQQPLLIVVTGSPASGKTTIAESLSEGMHLPLITKDELKEDIYDTLPGLSPDDSHVLDDPALQLILSLGRRLLEKDVSLILESNFKRSESSRVLRELFAISRPVLVQCVAPEDELVERYARRSKQGERHPVHEGAERAGELREEVERGEYDFRDLDLPLIMVNTSSDAGGTDIGDLIARIRETLGERSDR